MRIELLLKSKKQLSKANSNIVDGGMKGLLTTYDPEESEMFKGCKGLREYIELRSKISKVLEEKEKPFETEHV